MLTKTQTVLQHSFDGPRVAIFLLADEEAREDGPTVMLNRDVWDDMGRPETITVTIEPGDQLNA